MNEIGYRFRIKFDNGDTNEWYRETNIVSPIYSTKKVALKAFYLYLEKIEDKLRKQLLGCANRDKMIEETKLLYRSNVLIYPEFVSDEANIDHVIEFNIAY